MWVSEASGQTEPVCRAYLDCNSAVLAGAVPPFRQGTTLAASGASAVSLGAAEWRVGGHRPGSARGTAAGSARSR